MAKVCFTLQNIAELISAKVVGDLNCKVDSIATLQKATSSQISFLSNSKYLKYLETTQAAAVMLTAEHADLYQGNAIVVDDPYVAYAKLSQMFLGKSAQAYRIHPTATIDSTAKIIGKVGIAPGVVIGANTTINEGVMIGANTVIGDDCVVGLGTFIAPNVTLYNDVHVGEACIIHSGAVLGADGFGFAKGEQGWVKIAQLGGVRIGANVEVGAGTTIDRGALENTVISDGVILDNQIQIAHNVKIGKNTAIAGCTAVAGSTKIGDRCTIAGACGITGHLEIADDTHITAMTLVSKSITKPGVFSSGTGMMPHKQWKKNVVRFKQLDDIARRLKSIEETISED